MRSRTKLILTWCALAACGDDTTSSKTGPSLQITAGANFADTISAAPTQGLVVQVKGDDGRIASGVEVRFEAPPHSRMLVSGVTQPDFGDVAGAKTDASGRASVRVRFGEEAGAGWVAVIVPLYNLTDTARYTVQPGVAVGIGLEPQDTVIGAGASFTFRGGAVDRAGNPRAGTATYQVVGTAVTVTPAGVLTAAAPGAATVNVLATVNGATLTASARVLVVPQGTIAWTDYRTLRISDVAGSNIRTLAEDALNASWEPGGGRLVAVRGGGLIVIDGTSGNVAQLALPGVVEASWPEWSSDRQWIYFQAGGDFRRRIARVRPDGSDLQFITTGVTDAYMPSASPDGTRLVYVVPNGRLVIHDLQNGSTTELSVTSWAQAPRWSPDGSWIAYTYWGQGELMLVQPDGSGLRRIGAHGLWPGHSWSPDSKWIIGFERALTLVDVNTGVMSDLTHFGWYPREPAWKR